MNRLLLLLSTRCVLSIIVFTVLVGLSGCNKEGETFLPTSPTTNATTNANTNSNSIVIIIPIVPPNNNGGTNPGVNPINPNLPVLPPYGEGVVTGLAVAHPGLVQQSCVTQFGPAAYAWLDLVVDTLRLQDPRWGYVCDSPSCGGVVPDSISYYGGTGVATTGSIGIFQVDIIESYCLPNPTAGYLNMGFQASGRWSSRGRF